LRSEGKTLLEAVNETFAAARTAALKRVHLSHLKVAGRANWHKIGALINTIEAFRAEGFEVSADRYPYTESMTQLSIILPEPYDDMDDVALENTLRDAKGFRAVYEALRKLPAERWQTVRLVSAKCYEKFCGRDFAGIAKETGDDPALICAEILHADAAGALAAFRGMSEENMLRIMEKDFVACGTDESSRPQDYSLGRSHPRGFGSMPRFCNILLNSGMPLEKVIQRMTSLPAQIFRIPGKGLVKENFTADLVLLEPDKFKDHATFAVPHQICSGIRKVWRRGKVIFENNE
jgi:N-acyl-D-amino-acid deacylase